MNIYQLGKIYHLAETWTKYKAHKGLKPKPQPQPEPAEKKPLPKPFYTPKKPERNLLIEENEK